MVGQDLLQSFVDGWGGLEECRSAGSSAVVDVNLDVFEMDAAKRLELLHFDIGGEKIFELLLNFNCTQFVEMLAVDGRASLFVALGVVCMGHVDSGETWDRLTTTR